jgi:hypothetical protein
MADFIPWFGMCGGSMCWIGPIIAIILAIWVYKDAEERGDSNAVLWLIVVLFLGIIGLIIYLVVRKDKQPPQQYYQPPPQQPQYQQQAPPPVPAQQQYNCVTCGAPMRYVQNYQRWYCDHCGKYQ